jgi:hypothetical protein
MTQFAPPLRFSEFEFQILRAAPEPGEHTDEILGAAGYDWTKSMHCEIKRSDLVEIRFADCRVALLSGPGDAPAQGQEKDLDTPYVPTPQVVVDRMLELAQIKAGDTVIDLGSGDGRIMITAAQKYGARGFGVELNPRLVESSNDAARSAGVADRVKFLQQDLFKTDFREADVLTLYLLPDVNIVLRPKILADLKPGARVVSHDYGMGCGARRRKRSFRRRTRPWGTQESTVYLWIVPARVGGAWELEIHVGKRSRRYPLSLEQEYQVLTGSVLVQGKKAMPITRGALKGDEIRLELPDGAVSRGPVELVGRATGDALKGSVRRDRKEIATWSARRK